MAKNILAAVFALTVGILPCQGWTGEPMKLPPPAKTLGMDLGAALWERVSFRGEFDLQREPSPEVLSNVLWAAAGINRPADGKRTYPVAMGAYNLDIYVLSQEGAWLYNPLGHSLDKVSATDSRKFIFMQKNFAVAPLAIMVVYDQKRKPEKVNENDAMDSALVAAGCIMENAALASVAQGLGTVVVASVRQDAAKRGLLLEEGQTLLFGLPLGYAAK